MKTALDKPSEELAKTAQCVNEKKAFQDAWTALPVGGRDKKADPIFDQQANCQSLLSDAGKSATSRQTKP